MTGGGGLQQALEQYARNLSAKSATSVEVGFMPDALYDDGTSIAYVAAINEWGATIHREAGQTTIYRKVGADGIKLLRKGRFVRKSQANKITTHATPAYTITIPPRPFFRNMIAKCGPGWGAQVGDALKVTHMDARRALEIMGGIIKAQLVQSIESLTSPPNAPSTIRRKHASKPLVDTGKMRDNVEYQVKAP